MKNNQYPLLIIDSRFEYEYQGGHIKGAINLNKPENVEEFFFSDKK